MKYLLKFLTKRKGLLIAVILLLFGQVVGTLLVPYLIADLIDIGIAGANMLSIAQIGLKMLITSLVTAAVAIAGCYLSADFAAAFGRDMREAVFLKTQELSVKDFDTFGTSSLITRTTFDIANVQQTLTMILQMIVPAPLIVTASIAMTWLAKPELIIIPLSAIAFFVLVCAIVIKKSSALSQQMQSRMDKITQVVRESITGIRVIRAFDNAVYEKKRSDTAFESYAETIISINKLFAILNPMVWLAMGLSMAAIVWFGGLFSMKGTMAIGQITAVTEYTIMTLGYLIMAAFSIVTLPKMFTSLHRLEEILDTQPEILDPEHPYTLLPQPSPRVEFDNVTFAYHGAEIPVLKNLSFSCEAGKTTAIIGGTGSGKSTITAVLLRLYDIDSGQIRLNGSDIRALTQNDLREQIGYVPQKAFLFSGTIAENLMMGNKNATAQDMRRAVATAQAEDFIDSLPLGLYAPVAQGGVNFSGGQKQRLSIARALIKNTPVLIFDDSFSALDYQTDAALRRTLKNETADSVMIIIAQRISTILDADQIIVLDEGEIAGIGRHSDLLKNCPVYQEIAHSQLAREEEIAL